MKETKKRIAARMIPRGGPAWRTLRSAYYAPRNLIRGIYRHITKNSIFFDERELGMASILPAEVISKTIELFAPGTVLDLGCGVGKSLDYFHDRGIEIKGIEGSQLAISRARHPDLIAQFNLNNELNLGRKFDLLWCYEVVEHIHPAYVDNLMKTLSNHSDRVVLSAARPGQGGEGHFNEQLPEYWIEKFAKMGFRHDEKSTELLRSADARYGPNMLAFYR